MKITLHPEARIEFRDAVLYYREISNELSNRFRDEVVELVNSAVKNPHLWPNRKRNFRRANCREFNHYIIFQVIKNEFIVIAIAHQSRRPDYWKHRLSSN